MPATDLFSTRQDALADPCDNAFAITPSDSTEFTYVTRGVVFDGVRKELPSEWLNA